MKYCEGRTMCFRKPSVLSFAAVVGKAENDGPYGGEFDEVIDDNKGGADTWEQAEALFQRRAVNHVLRKAELTPDRIDLVIAGDLLNQCVGSSYGLKDYFMPYLGIYGACSTFAEGLLLSAALVNAGYMDTVIASTSSHYSTAERQFRFPLNYGGVRTPTSQWTATAAGAALVGSSGKPPFIRAATIGKIEDMGITDMNNMGAAMAPAACSTITAFLQDTKTQPEDLDLILTGDLGYVGSTLLRELMRKQEHIDITTRHNDCGLMLYRLNEQDVNSGGSGCGCSAAVVCSHIVSEMRSGRLNKVLFVGTGALLSAVSPLQGETVPSIAHAVLLTN